MGKLVVSCMLNLLIVGWTVYTVIWYFAVANKGKPAAEQFQVFQYFTILSNVFSGIVSAVLLVLEILMIPNETLALPDWAMLLRLASTSGVTLTFLTVVFFLAPKIGWHLLYKDDNLYMHVLGPVMAIVVFLVMEGGRDISFLEGLIGMIPMVLYGAVYMIEVVIIGEEKGGWHDLYGFNEDGKWYISLPAMVTAGFAISELLVLLHNL